MHTKTIKYNGATITVKTEVGWMRMNKWIAENRLELYDNDGKRQLPGDVTYHRQQFASVLAQSTVEGHLGFEWPSVTDDNEVIQAACEAWLNLPGQVVEDWVNALSMVNASPNDDDLKPANQVSEKKDETIPT